MRKALLIILMSLVACASEAASQASSKNAGKDVNFLLAWNHPHSGANMQTSQAQIDEWITRVKAWV